MALFTKISPLAHAPSGMTHEGRQLVFSLYVKDAEKIEYLFYPNPYQMKMGQQYSRLECVELNLKTFSVGNLWNWKGELTADFDENYVFGVVIRIWKIDPQTGKAIPHLVIDPYSRETSGGEQWRQSEGFEIDAKTLKIKRIPRTSVHDPYVIRRLPVLRYYHYNVDRPAHPRIPLSESIIYECHVRGFTNSPTSRVSDPKYRGTYKGLTECIPYFLELGVTTIELLPIYDFDENENVNVSPFTREPLINYWGYSPLLFLAPKQSYAYNMEDPISEFKEMIDAFHEAGLEVILDVVYNHTAEQGSDGPIDHFRWLDEETYYIYHKTNLANYSGCGNTLNCSHPVVKRLILQSLRYWVNEIGVDGFRFDLASILDRNHEGQMNAFPYLLWEIKNDPALSAGIKVIAEPWDSGGGYQLGHIAYHACWAEWNDRFRNTVRKAVKGEDGMIWGIMNSLAGSPDVYQSIQNGRDFSINFLTAHDGMTMWDLVSYNHKHNEENGEENRDGTNDNFSYNCGIEGPTKDMAINNLRWKKMRMMHLMLQISNGTPMLLGGDELARTQLGNNNLYCIDSPLNWVDWRLVQKNVHLLRFVKQAIAIRKQYRDLLFSTESHYSWFNSEGGEADYSSYIRTLVWHISHPSHPKKAMCVLLNFFHGAIDFKFPESGQWFCVMDTKQDSNVMGRIMNNIVKVAGFSIQIYRRV
ncbi:MAG: glycogen debranching enzyme [SAR324 cluster bacterium]|nr:glycogen debranching enzyme [SAR324 cluster bacterium]